MAYRDGQNRGAAQMESNVAEHDIAPEDSPESLSTVGLIKRLMQELTTLFRQELALATREIAGSLSIIVAAVLSALSGGAVAFAGLLVLAGSAVLALAQVLVPWLAALIVGAALAVIGGVMVFAGGKMARMAELKPRLSAESLRKDTAVISRKTS